MTDSPHATLTAAANKIRQMADEATQGEWVSTTWGGHVTLTTSQVVAITEHHPDAALIALGSPDMWRLVADLLDDHAELAYLSERAGDQPTENERHALAVADHVLGES